MSDAPLHSVVVPAYNEELVLSEFWERMRSAMEPIARWELIIVDDGSTDATDGVIARLVEGDDRIRAISLSRNFGHQTAISAGIDMADGDTVTVIDADLQDPPEVIPALITEWEKGADVVFAVRESRAGETAFKKATAAVFYRVIGRLSNVDIPADAGDFRLMSRKATQGLRTLRERSRYIRGLVGWMGLRRAYVTYARDARAAGETKYPLGRMLRLAADGVVSFSTKPLQIALYLGFAASAIGLAYGLYLIAFRLVSDEPVQGWTSTMVALVFFGGVQLITIGIIGEYVGRIYDEVRKRPLYLVQDVSGFPDPTQASFAEDCTPYADRRCGDTPDGSDSQPSE